MPVSDGRTLAEWMAETDAETDRMIASLEAKLAESEKNLAATKHNRDTILAEKSILEGKYGKALRGTATELHISTKDSHDAQKYQAMKALAARQGRTLQVVDPTAPSGPEPRSRVKFVEDRDAGVLYANAAIRDRVGIARLQEIARERGLPTSKTFRYPHELPDHLLRQHAQTLADRAVDTLLDD